MSAIRTPLLGAVLSLVACSFATAAQPAAARAAAPPNLSVTVSQGEVARWPGIAAKTCLLGQKQYPSVDSVCYYPFDVEAKPGRYPIGVIDQDGKHHRATAIVEKADWPKVDITLPNDTYIKPTAENQKRALAERTEVLKLFAFKNEPARFSLPMKVRA